jgi:hypothetical protein
MSLRNFKELDSYQSNACVQVTLLEETLSAGEHAYSVRLTDDGGDYVVLDFTSESRASEFFSGLRKT